MGCIIFHLFLKESSDVKFSTEQSLSDADVGFSDDVEAVALEVVGLIDDDLDEVVVGLGRGRRLHELVRNLDSQQLTVLASWRNGNPEEKQKGCMCLHW